MVLDQVTVKFVALVAVPAVVEQIGPVVAPAGTIAFTLMADLNMNPVRDTVEHHDGTIGEVRAVS